jgi:hypothetical protein
MMMSLSLLAANGACRGWQREWFPFALGDPVTSYCASFALLSRHTRRREFIAGLGGATAWPPTAWPQKVAR